MKSKLELKQTKIGITTAKTEKKKGSSTQKCTQIDRVNKLYVDNRSVTENESYFHSRSKMIMRFLIILKGKRSNKKATYTHTHTELSSMKCTSHPEYFVHRF